jgi:hypothetical protein
MQIDETIGSVGVFLGPDIRAGSVVGLKAVAVDYLVVGPAEIALAGWVGCTEEGLEGGVVGDDGGESLSYAALAGEDHGVEGREGGL